MKELSSVPCAACGCVCDDLRVTVDDGRIVSAENACDRAKAWFVRPAAGSTSVAAIDGKPVDIATAYERAAEILRVSKNPLLYGFANSPVATVRAAAALADRLGATIDVAGAGHAAIVAKQQVGESTCTLGEVKQRADLVLFWGCDPARSHPRFIERYCPPRPGRTDVVVDEEETATAKSADHFVKVATGGHVEALWKLRLRLGSHPLPPAQGESNWDDLVSRMKAARFGVVFFGDRLTVGPNAHRTVESLFQLVTDLNRFNRFYARYLRQSCGAAEAVLSWQFGYPFGVNLSAGYPRYNPGEFTGAEMLVRREADACLIAGFVGIRELPAKAMEYLTKIPTILLDEIDSTSALVPSVRFTTAVPGIHTAGTVNRLDDVFVGLRPLLPSTLPDAAHVLEELLRRVNRAD